MNVENQPVKPNSNEDEQKLSKPPESILDSTKQEQTVNLPEREKREKEVFLDIAQKFLSNGEIDVENLELKDKEIVAEKLQEDFQENLLKHFKQAGLSDEIELIKVKEELTPSNIPLDEQALNLIVEKTKGKHGWVDMLPNLRKLDKDAGMNCTMRSAMLHIALEQLGYKGVRTVSCEGHHVVFRELDDGSIKLYDQVISGFSRTFGPKEITKKEIVDEGGGRMGYAVTLLIGEGSRRGNSSEAVNESGQRSQKFYAYDSNTKMNVGTAFKNLS